MMPSAVPAASPESNRTGKYKNTFKSCIIMTAIINWPRLWATPPAKLTPIILNFSVFFNPSMTPKLIIPPANEYMVPNTPENSKPDTPIRTRLIAKVSGGFNSYIATRIIKFGNPILTPGIPKLIGKRNSKYDRIIAIAENTAQSTNLLTVKLFCDAIITSFLTFNGYRNSVRKADY